jgi:uncharacterized protein YbgA (DUF1722 family)
LRERYERAFLAALAEPATRAGHARALRRALACLGDRTPPRVRQQLAAQIADYRAGRVPLAVPATRIRHCAEQLGVEYLAAQVYLDPHPAERALRSSA